MDFAGVDLNELEIENIGNWPFFIRVIIIIAIFILTLFMGYMFDLSDEWDVLTNSQNKRIELENTFESAQHKVANLDSYKRQVKEVEDQLERLTEQLPQTNEGAGLLEDISQQASTSGLQFVSIKPGEEQQKGFYIEDPIKLTLSGSYHGMGDFASSISSMPRIVTLHEFTITRITKEESLSGPSATSQPMKGPLVMTVVAKTYWTAPGNGRNK